MCLCAHSLTKVCLSCRIWPENYFIYKVPGERETGKVPCTFHSLVAQTVKNLPAVQEMWVQSLGWEDPWRRAWLSTPAFLPREFYGQRSLEGYSPWGHKQSDMTEQLTHNELWG